MKLKLILTDSIHFFLTNLPQIATLCLPWLVAGAVIEYLVVITPVETGDSPMFYWAIAFNLLVLPIYTASLILLMAKQAQNQRPGNQEILMGAFKVWQPFFLLYVLVGALMLLATLLALAAIFLVSSILIGAPANTIFGLVLIFPVVLWVLARLSFAKFYLVLNGLNPVEAIQKSFQATQPHVRLILSLTFLYAVPVLVVMFFSTGLPESHQGDAIRALIGTATSFVLLLVDVLIFRVYMETIQENTPDNNQPA